MCQRKYICELINRIKHSCSPQGAKVPFGILEIHNYKSVPRKEREKKN